MPYDKCMPGTSGTSKESSRRNTDDINNPAYKKPIDFGWQRKTVQRKKGKIALDVYYFNPTGKKFRSLNEIRAHLEINPSPLTIENFTFRKESLPDDKKKIDPSTSSSTHQQLVSPMAAVPCLALVSCIGDPEPKVVEAAEAVTESPITDEDNEYQDKKDEETENVEDVFKILDRYVTERIELNTNEKGVYAFDNTEMFKTISKKLSAFIQEPSNE